MLHLYKNSVSDPVVVTGSELALLPNPVFLFVFTPVVPGATIPWLAVVDTSNAPARYNRYLVPTSTLFANCSPGEWHYKIYEQPAGGTTTNPNGLHCVEVGKMRLHATTTGPTLNQTENKFIAYGG